MKNVAVWDVRGFHESMVLWARMWAYRCRQDGRARLERKVQRVNLSVESEILILNTEQNSSESERVYRAQTGAWGTSAFKVRMNILICRS